MWRSALLCSLLGALLLAVPSSSVAVMSVDLGSEWMKVAVVTVSALIPYRTYGKTNKLSRLLRSLRYINCRYSWSGIFPPP